MQRTALAGWAIDAADDGLEITSFLREVLDLVQSGHQASESQPKSESGQPDRLPIALASNNILK